MRAKVKSEPPNQCYRSCLSKQLRRNLWGRLGDRVRSSLDLRRPKFPPFWRKESVSLTPMLWNAPEHRGHQHLHRHLNIGFSSASPGSAATTRIWKQPTIGGRGYSGPWTGFSKCSADLATGARSPFITRMICKLRQQIPVLCAAPATDPKPPHESQENSGLLSPIFKFIAPSFFISLAAIDSRNARAGTV